MTGSPATPVTPSTPGTLRPVTRPSPSLRRPRQPRRQQRQQQRPPNSATSDNFTPVSTQPCWRADNCPANPRLGTPGSPPVPTSTFHLTVSILQYHIVFFILLYVYVLTLEMQRLICVYVCSTLFVFFFFLYAQIGSTLLDFFKKSRIEIS